MLNITVRLIEIGCSSNGTKFVEWNRVHWSSTTHPTSNISSSSEGILDDVVERGGWWDLVTGTLVSIVFTNALLAMIWKWRQWKRWRFESD